MPLLITDLPRMMREKLHWSVAATCMERWFRSPSLTMADAVKVGNVAMDRLPQNELVTELLTMEPLS